MVTFYELHEIEDFRLKFAVIVTKTESGKWVFCKHQNRDTWECPGGHREPGEKLPKLQNGNCMRKRARLNIQ